MKLTLERQIPLVFGIAILLLAIVVFFAFRSMNSLTAALKWEKHTQEVLSQLDETLNLTVDAETGGRGFMITRDDTFLEPFTQAKQKIGGNLEKLRGLIADNPNQTERVAKLETLINGRIALLKDAVELRRTASIEEVREQIGKGRGRDLMNEVRLVIDSLKIEEKNLLAEREAELDRNLTTTYRMLYLVSFAGILSLGFANLAVFREIGKRRKAEDDLRDSNRDLEKRVEKRTHELSQTNIELKEQIRQREESEAGREDLLRKEQAARREAEIANRLRDEFLATVSHELRAPLNSILGWGRLLEKGNLDEKTTQKALGTIVRNAESQNRLIDDLLDVSRIISGKLRLEIQSIKPLNIVEAAMETVRPAAEAKGISLEIQEKQIVSHISGDPNRLQQVVWNLLSNAIKFTPNGGEVCVEIERVNGCVEIRVKDTGIGIGQEFLPYVFDRFRQADTSSIRKFGGLGLGLAIVRHITEMHGGTVSAASDGENQGTTFTVSLPVAADLQNDVEFDDAPQSIASQTAPKLSLDGLLILAVDDEEDTRQLLVQSLTFYGATVITAKSAAEGLTALLDQTPDVLVSDIGMPDEDGYTLIRKIRALPGEQQKNVKAIALTAFTRAQDRMRALAAGYQNHVAKPVEPDELATVIASLTGRLHSEDVD